VKRILLLLVLLFAGQAFAAGCDMALKMQISHSEGKVSKDTMERFGLPRFAVDEINKRGATIVNVASQVENSKTGDHVVTFSSSYTCDGGPAVEAPELTFERIDLKGLAKILHQSAKVGLQLLRETEAGPVAKGANRAWKHDDKKPK
jgi:hypothetical protein